MIQSHIILSLAFRSYRLYISGIEPGGDMSDSQYQRDPDWTAYIERSRELSHEERVIREQVVREYLFDFNWTKACLRCGFRSEFADDTAKRFMLDPYCIWRVKTLSRELNINITPEQKSNIDEEKKSDILTALEREANYFGPGSSSSARVAALGKLAQLRGMEPPKQVKKEVKLPGVMVAPGIATIDEWEAVATKAQEQLQTDTLSAIEKGNKNVH